MSLFWCTKSTYFLFNTLAAAVARQLSSRARLLPAQCPKKCRRLLLSALRSYRAARFRSSYAIRNRPGGHAPPPDRRARRVVEWRIRPNGSAGVVGRGIPLTSPLLWQYKLGNQPSPAILKGLTPHVRGTGRCLACSCTAQPLCPCMGGRSSSPAQACSG